MTPYLLEVKDLHLAREGRLLLAGVNLTLLAGEIHVLLGLNGSGKSTLAYTIMDCAGYQPDRGSILFEGRDITHLSISERARLGITLAWQEPARFEGIPVGKYISLGMANPDRQRVLEALEAVGLPPERYAYRSVDKTLSGGERKRIELAAVYAMRPRLAILDEPDSGVDALSLSDIEALIQRMASEGSTILLITHRDELASIGNRASLMCLGSIAFSGEPEETRRFYRRHCYAHQNQLEIPAYGEKATPEEVIP